jgi:hypothetical protein
MPAKRKATSPEELAQVVRVQGLLADLDVARRPRLAVTTANFATRTGDLLRMEVRNTGTKAGGRACQGALTLATPDGDVEINFLDIVSVSAARAGSAASR